MAEALRPNPTPPNARPAWYGDHEPIRVSSYATLELSSQTDKSQEALRQLVADQLTANEEGSSSSGDTTLGGDNDRQDRSHQVCHTCKLQARRLTVPESTIGSRYRGQRTS